MGMVSLGIALNFEYKKALHRAVSLQEPDIFYQS
jgi:hypothetical protein